MQPRPNAETLRPERPRVRVFIQGFLSHKLISTICVSRFASIDAVAAEKVLRRGFCEEDSATKVRPQKVLHKLRRLRPVGHLLERHDSPATMNQPPIWFERKFDFTFPVEQHPNLCVRLRGTPARLEEILRAADR